ncbi:MAG: hypothetical protein U1E17_06015 [Geminicoccaceae bacterium]
MQAAIVSARVGLRLDLERLGERAHLVGQDRKVELPSRAAAARRHRSGARQIELALERQRAMSMAEPGIAAGDVAAMQEATRFSSRAPGSSELIEARIERCWSFTAASTTASVSGEAMPLR